MPRLPRSRLLPLGLLFALCLLLPSFALAGELAGAPERDALALGNGSGVELGGKGCGGEGAVPAPREGEKLLVRPTTSDLLPTLSQDKAGEIPAAAAATKDSQDPRSSPVAVAPELPIFVLQSPSQLVVTVAHSSGLPRRAIARVDGAVNPSQDAATSGVVSFVCKSIGLFLTLVVTAVVVFLASGPGL
ncbi:hypothetical protein JCM10450v2_006862 [Rhodotorula kratochvilovae]